jgi:hypothetical protein
MLPTMTSLLKMGSGLCSADAGRYLSKNDCLSLLSVLMFAWPLLAGMTAQAVIKLEFPVTRIYGDAKTVRSATIVAVDVGGKLIEARPDETFKGGAAPERLRVQIEAPADLINRVTTHQPLLIFGSATDGKGAALLHVADTWVLAQGVPDAKTPTWRVVQPYDAARAYPGRTAGLVRLVAAMKAGRSPLEDKIDPACFAGEIREVANVGAKASSLETADLNGDGRVDLLVGTAEGVRLYLASATGYSDATAAWGLQGVAATHAAVGDANGDGRLDLLLGSVLLLRKGEAFARAAHQPDLPPESEWLTTALGDATGDGAADGVVLLRTGELVVVPNVGADKPGARISRKLWEDGTAAAACFSTDWGETDKLHLLVVRGKGITRYAITPDGDPPTAFAQLTGTVWPPALIVDGQSAGAVKCVAADCDGNGKRDFLLLAPSGGVTVLNRGFGAYYADYTIHVKLRQQEGKTLPFALTPGTLLAAGQTPDGASPRQNLLVLTEDGRLFELRNPAPREP